MDRKLEYGQIGAIFGERIPVAEKFRNSVCMMPLVGQYFHDPVDYPRGELGGWRRVCWLPVEAVWPWILHVAGHVDIPQWHWREGNLPAPTFAELREKDPLQVLDPRSAVVLQVTEKAILAVYRDPEPPADAPYPFCLIRLRP